MISNTQEGNLVLDDGFAVYTKTWKTVNPPKAVLAFIHGFSDHCNAYGAFFPSLAAKGIEVCSFDQRGWGRSVYTNAEKGLTGPTPRVMDDITCFIRSILPVSAPFFLMGHSMGGAEVLCWIHDGPDEVKRHIRGYLLESPFVAFNAKSKPSNLKVIAGRLGAKLLPNFQMIFKLDPNLISRDPDTVEQFETDPLCHDTGTLEGLAGNLDRANGLNDGEIKIPQYACENYENDGGKTKIFLSHGTGDGICDFHGTEGVYKRLDSLDDAHKTLKLYDGWYHRLHAEPGQDRVQYISDITTWMFNRLGAGSDVPVTREIPEPASPVKSKM